MISHDNLEEYRDALLYDAMNGGSEIGGDFYLHLARQYGGPILDLACGTGRMTIPLAEHGYACTGIDITPEMLALAKEKAKQHAVSIKWLQADIREFASDEQYRFILMTGNSFQALLSPVDQHQLLQRVHEHLLPNGVFAFETRNPVLRKLLINNGAQKDAGHYVSTEGNRVNMTEERWYDDTAQIEHYVTTRKWTNDQGNDEHSTARISIRYTFPKELETLLCSNGFELMERYGDFHYGAFHSESPLMVCVCQKSP